MKYEEELDVAYGYLMGLITAGIIYSYFITASGSKVGLLGSGLFFDIWFTFKTVLFALVISTAVVFTVYVYLSEKLIFEG